MRDVRPGERVVVGMSGGVDSSVAAALLVEAGCDVIGIAMRLWGGASGGGCCSLDDFIDARRVAARIGIPFYVMDFCEVFDRRVVAPFVDDYIAGRTPNPCIRCNQFVKFASLWDRARELGATWIATGHYARVAHDDNGGYSELQSAVDAAKDQSYYLFAIDPEALKHTLFPLGAMTKGEVRAAARTRGLPVAEKPESQEICFVPDGDYARVVQRYAGERLPRAGAIVDGTGRCLGQHAGVHQFTVGQRRGLGISARRPLYVTAIDSTSGTVQVGPRQATFAKGLTACRPNWLSGVPVAPGTALQVKIRSRFVPADVVVTEATARHFTLEATRQLNAVTPGQAAVLYDRHRVVGGGWIEHAIPRQTA